MKSNYKEIESCNQDIAVYSAIGMNNCETDQQESDAKQLKSIPFNVIVTEQPINEINCELNCIWQDSSIE